MTDVDVVPEKNRLAGTFQTSGVVDDGRAVALGSRWGRLLAHKDARRQSE
ncbi:MAG TPA: hypothetical protein VFK15_10690 [Burkholderiales bacterium]|nr:hypothetical protein [Burkholderiales bacterium]